MLARIKYLTAGESHGKGLLGIIDGLPAGLEIDEKFISYELFRRQQGHGRGGRMKIEKDHAEIYTGIRHGKSLGSPIGLILPNKDWKNWTVKMSPEPVDEKIKTVGCKKESKKGCTGKSVKCIAHNLWDDLENHINSFFEKNTLKDIIFKENKDSRGSLKQ